jgi:hypothetical protein
MVPPNGKPASAPKIPDSVLRWFEARSPEELEAKEYDRRILYPATLKRKRATDKGHTEDPVLVRVPNVPERSQAQVDACRWVGRLIGWKEKLPPTIDQATSHVGASEFRSMSIACLMALCIREVKEPHLQFSLAEELTNTYGVATLAEIADRIDVLSEQEDPRLPILDDDVFRALVLRIAEGGSLLPLVGIAGRERTTFIVTLAARHASYLTSGSSPPSSATSTPATPPSSAS